MSEPVFFTLQGDFRGWTPDVASDGNYSPESSAISATVTITPLLDGIVRATTASPRPIAHLMAPTVGIIDPADGRLKLRTQGEAGNPDGYTFTPIRLLANSDYLELDPSTPLYYRLTFTSVSYGGVRGSIPSWDFEAPSTDTTINIVETAPQTGAIAHGLTKIAPGGVRLDGGNLIFSFAGVDIPDPVPLTPTFTATEITDSTATGRALLAAADAADARTLIGAEEAATKGQPDGYAPLNSSALIDAAFLPSYVDDVLEYADQAAFPGTGETGKIYVDISTGDAFRWSGSTYVRISDRVTASGITDSTSVGRAVLTASTQAAARTAISSVGRGDFGYNVKDYGAVGDGSTDDTAAIHAARDAAGGGGTVVFPPGTYKVVGNNDGSGGLLANVASQVWNITPGATIQIDASHSRAALTVDAANVTITGGGTLSGNRVALGNNPYNVLAVILGTVNSNHLTVQNVTVQNAAYRGIWGQGSHTRVLMCKFFKNWMNPVLLSSYYLGVQIGSTMQDTYDMEVSDCYIDCSDEDPATFTSAPIQIRGNTGGGVYGVDDVTHTTYRGKALRNTILMPLNPSESTGRVCGIEFGAKSYYGLAAGNTIINGTMGISFAYGNYGKAIGNTLIGQVLAAVEISRSPGVVVSGNVIDGAGLLGSLPSASAIWGNGDGDSSDITIVGNRIFGIHTSGRSISLSGNRVTITGNNIQSRTAITLSALSDATITGNVFYGDGSGNGMQITNCNNIAVTGNTLDTFVNGVRFLATSGTADYINVSNNQFRLCQISFDGTASGGTLGTNIINAQNIVRAS